MDQLASIGVEFQDETIERVFNENRRYYEHRAKEPPIPWAIPEIYNKHKPVRPWGLGKIYNSVTGFYRFAGRITRTPGQYKRSDPDTGLPTDIPMTHTNERIHSSVRIRIELGGLGLDDKGLYDCPALLGKGLWRLRQTRIKVYDPIPRNADWGARPVANGVATAPEDSLRWVWQWDGPREAAPHIRTMIEENLGPYERRLLLLNTGMSESAPFQRSVAPRARRASAPASILFLSNLAQSSPYRSSRDHAFDLSGGLVKRRFSCNSQ
jgi:hypothetical protein